MERIYYEDQTGWGIAEFYQLFRNLARLFQYREKMADEFHQLEPSRASMTTKTMIKAFLLHHKLEGLMDTAQFNELKDIGPLEKPLLLEDYPTSNIPVFNQYNIYF